MPNSFFCNRQLIDLLSGGKWLFFVDQQRMEYPMNGGSGRTVGRRVLAGVLVPALLTWSSLSAWAQAGAKRGPEAAVSTSRSDDAAGLVSSLGVGFVDGYAEVDGIKLHYVSGGEGPPLLLIPGWLQTWYAWRGVMPILAKQGFRVIAVDPRGMGQSSRPAGGYDTGRLAADLHGLMGQLGYKRYSVLGHDIGMWIGYALASDHPEAVERLAVVEAAIPGLMKSPPDVFMPQRLSAFFWQFLFNQQTDLPEMLIQGRERAFMAYLFDRWAFKSGRIALDVYADVYSAPGAMRAQFEYYRAFPETIAQNAKRAERKLPMPVLALGGDRGVADFPLTMLRPVAINVQGSVLEGCGHFVPEECPEALLDKVVPFMRAAQ